MGKTFGKTVDAAHGQAVADRTARALSAGHKGDPSEKGEIDRFNEHPEETGPDDIPNLAARREAARDHSDSYLVDTDLEDAEQREASPGTREQS